MAAQLPAQPPSYEETTGGFNNSAPNNPPPAGGNKWEPPGPQYSSQPYSIQGGPYPGGPPVQAVFIPNPVFLDRPMQMRCPACGRMIVTKTVYRAGALTWLSCGGLCLLGCSLGCCLIPFCVDAMLDVEHHCPSCNTLLGVFKRM